MSNFNKYLKDINPELFEQLAKKQRRKELLYGIAEGIGFILAILLYLVILYKLFIRI